MSEVANDNLPEGWAKIPLGQFRGKTAKSIDPSNFPEEIFELYSVPSFSEGMPEIISGEEIGSSKRIVEPNTVLLSKINPRINRVWIVGDKSKKRQISSPEWVEFFPTEGIEPKYLMYFMQNREFRDHLCMNVSGVGGSLTRIRPKVAEDYEIPMAPPEQQKRIVAKIEELFSHIDAGIAALKKAKQLLKQYRQSVLKAAVTGELTKDWREANKHKLEPASQLLERILKERRQQWEAQQLEQFKAKGKIPKDDKWKEKYKEPVSPDTDNLPEIPKEWVWSRLDSIAFVGSGMSVSKSRKVKDPLEVAYLRVANVQRGFLVLDEMKTIQIEKNKLSELELQKWDVLYNEGGDIDKLGRGWIWENQVQPCITQNHVFRASPYIKDRRHSVFLSTWGNTFGQEYFLNTGIQTTNLASINKGVLSAFPTPLPSIAEQEKIIETAEEKLESIARLESVVEAQLIKAERNKQSILATAFSGDLIEETSPEVSASHPEKIQGISETDIHAGVIAMAIRAHEIDENRANTLGHVKCEKLAHLVESHLGISLGRAPYKDAAGPNDYKHLHKVDSRGKKTGWFEAKKLKGGRHKYVAGTRIEEIIGKLRSKLDHRFEEIEQLIALIAPMKTEQAEIVATLYAGWNNLLVDGLNPTDEQIVYESRENWHESKLGISRKRFFSALAWMKNKDLVPKGKGKRVGNKPSNQTRR